MLECDKISDYEMELIKEEFIKGYTSKYTTRFERRVAETAKIVRSGIYGKVISEGTTTSWGDTVPSFEMNDGQTLVALDGGVYKVCASGGMALIRAPQGA